jgi:hypothetical protein
VSTHEEQPRPATEEELRAAYEAEVKKIRIEQILLEHVVTLVNMGMRRTGLVPGTEDERDPSQVKVAIETIRALMPLLEQIAPQQVAPIRDALSQLQLAYVQIGGGAAGEAAAGPGAPSPAAPGGPSEPPAPDAPGAGPTPRPPKPGEAGPAQRSGRLWVPGQK